MGIASGASALTPPPELTVFVDAPPAWRPRAEWVLATLLAGVGRRLRFTTTRDEAVGCALAYASRPLTGVPTVPLSSRALELFGDAAPLPPGSYDRFDTAIGELPGAFPVDPPAVKNFCAPFDLVASSFVLLAAWDERTHAERDRFGRLPFASSVFAENPALRIDEPAVDRAGALLRAALTPRLTALGLPPLPAPGWVWRAESGAIAEGDGEAGAGGPRFAVALTHDIDNLWRWTRRGFAASGYRFARSLRRLEMGGLVREAGDVGHWLTHHLPRRTDPHWTFPHMLAGEAERGVDSTFFVIARHTHRQDGRQPVVYQRRIPEVLDLLRQGRREVGLHGNDSDRLGVSPLCDDRTALEARTGDDVRGIRYHYLRCLYHETLPLVDAAGLDYDSSLAFAEHEGFRCGTALPFHPYLLAEERPLRLVELPLAVMDTTLHQPQYRGLPAPEAEQAARRVLERVREAGGAAALLWHNMRFDPREAQGYDGVYWRLTDWLLAEGAIAGAAGPIVDRWRRALGEEPFSAGSAPPPLAGPGSTAPPLAGPAPPGGRSAP
jgi:peptidoglycan/xylan/chitin deacetylase (PgdA/CDA1 family)